MTSSKPDLTLASAILSTLFTHLPPPTRARILHRLTLIPSSTSPLPTIVRRAALAEARPPNAIQQALEMHNLVGHGKHVRKRGTIRREVVRITMEGEAWRRWGPVGMSVGEVGEWVEKEVGGDEKLEGYDVIEMAEVAGVDETVEWEVVGKWNCRAV